MAGILILAFGGLIYLAYALVSSSPANSLYKIGVDFLENDNPAEAEQYFLRALELDPAHISAVDRLVSYYELQKDYDKVKFYLKRMVQSALNPFDKQIMNFHLKLAEIYFGERKFQDAWQIYLQLIKMGCVSADLFFRLGELFMLQKRYGEAVCYFDESLSFESNRPLVLYYKGISLIAMKEFKEAIAPLSMMPDDSDVLQQSTFLLGKIYYDLNSEEEAQGYFGSLLTVREPIFLADILLYRVYYLLKKIRKDKPVEEELSRLVQYLNRALSIKDLTSIMKKEFLYHLAGVYLLSNNIDEARTVYRDLNKLDSFYRGIDQIYKAISKEMLIKEERDKIIDTYKSEMMNTQLAHAISEPIDLNYFFPDDLPILVLEQLEENAQRRYLECLKKASTIRIKSSTLHPKTAIDLANANYELFVEVCLKIVGKMGIVAGKNLSDDSNLEASFAGIDRNDEKSFVYFSKPVSLTGALSIVDITERKEKAGASRLHYVSCGTFTEEARVRAKDMRVHLYDKEALRRLL